MSLLNFFKRKPKIKIGDTVKCIDDRDWGDPKETDITLQYGKTYKILDITITSCCGCICLDIGGKFINPNYFTTCGNHDKTIQGKGIHWADSRRFAPHVGSAEEQEKEETATKEQLKKKLEKALASEDYERATTLRDLINH